MRLASIMSLDDRAEAATFEVEPTLAEHVHGYWRLSVVNPPARLRVLPDGHVDLVFEAERRQAYVMAQLALPAGALSPGWAPLEAVLGERGRALAERVADAPTTLLRVGVVETFLFARLAPRDLRIERALSTTIDASDGRVSVAELRAHRPGPSCAKASH